MEDTIKGKLPPALETRLKKLNCKWTIDDKGIANIELGFAIKSVRRPTKKDAEKVAAIVRTYYPNAPYVIIDDKVLGIHVFFELENSIYNLNNL